MRDSRNNFRELKAAMPRNIKPMLATLTDKPFDKEGWSFEVKWDGYRTIAEIEKGKVALFSRNRNSFNELFAPIAEALRNLKYKAILDGEVVVLDKKGRSSFQLLQNYSKTGEGNLVYYIFDILYFDGYDLVRLPLKERRRILKSTIRENQKIRISYSIEKSGKKFFKVAKQQGLEGIIAKDSQSDYKPGKRSSSWLKIKSHMRQEAVIAGFTSPRGGRKYFGALILGVYNMKKLVYIGHTGGGFDGISLRDMINKLKPLVQKNSSFDVPPRTNTPVTWVKPKLVCEVSFQEWTNDGVMRQPIFLGLRADKKPGQVKRELPKIHINNGKKRK
jgi:bifunctional non-homologous end joining protein LigD